MQCFQKDPNLRVSAKKLLKHAWIVGSRRSDAPVAKAPSNFSQAVEEVKQWNEALKSSETNLRASIGSDSGPPQFNGHGGSRLNGPDPHRSNLTRAQGPLVLAKPRPSAEAFRSPELADDDNWDNDFATTIPSGALHLPHIKGQDNFGGLLSGDRLKAFASIDDSRDEFETWDDTFDGELLTIKGPRHFDADPQEQTIRPLPKKSEKVPEQKTQQGGSHKRPKSSKASVTGSSQTKSPAKPHFGAKFELPPRLDLMYREQSVEDYSDLLADNDSVFSNMNNRLNIVKVRLSWTASLSL